MAEDVAEHVVRLREDASGWRQVDGPRLTPDDPFLTGLEESRAEQLVRSNWALEASTVEAAEAFYPADADDQADEAESETEAADIDGDDFSANGWLENDYQDRAEAVRAGGLDDYLDAIEDAETSQTVIDAVDERRAELADES